MYVSRKLLPRVKKYLIIEKEWLAVKWALDTLKYYHLGRKFTLITDHAPLCGWQEVRTQNDRVTCWFLSLQQLSFYHPQVEGPARQCGHPIPEGCEASP